MSNETCWPSFSERRPAASTAEACTNTSLPPPSGEMNPKPLVVLKNFTVPMVICISLNIEFPDARDAHAGRGEREHQYLRRGPFRPARVSGSVSTEALRLTGRKNHVARCMRLNACNNNQRAETHVYRRLSAPADAPRGRGKQSAHRCLDQAKFDQLRAMR